METNLSYCSNHPELFVISICITKGCCKYLCRRCVAIHSLQHAENKTYMVIKDIEDAKIECLTKLEDTKNAIKINLEELSLNPIDKTLNILKRSKENTIKLINEFFSQLEKDIYERTKSYKEIKSLINDTSNMQLAGTLTNHLQAIEKDIANLKNEDLYLIVLKDILANNFDEKLKSIKSEATNINEPLKLWVADNVNEDFYVMLKKTYKLFINIAGDNLCELPNQFRDNDDIEIMGTNVCPLTIKKKGNSSSPSVLLGPEITNGVNVFKVRIDQLSGAGWVSIGLIENPNINMKQSNYSNAYCICSDQSFYKLNVQHQATILSGGVFTVKTDFFKKEIEIISENGLLCKANFTASKLYPYFEMTHPHQMTILSFTHGTK